MADDRPPLFLGVNLQGFGQRPASWRTQEGITGREQTTPAFWRELGQHAERALIDVVFFADHPAATDPNVRPLGLIEPFLALGEIAQATTHLGLVGSASTTYNDPVDLAERLLSLDVISGGRVGWNAVTTYAPAVAANFGLEGNPPRAERYARAHAFAAAVRSLWQSAGTGAAVRFDQGPFAFETALPVPPSAQGHPVVFQAGGSPDGRAFAAAQADAVFAVELLREPAIQNRRELQALARAQGREVAVVPGLSLVLGSTEAEARARYDASEALAPDGYTRAALGTHLGADLSELDLDRPLPAELLRTDYAVEDVASSAGYRRTVLAWVRENNTSLRDLLRDFGGYGARIVVGTPEQAADTIEDWFRSGAADGFNLMVDEFPTGLATIADQLTPELQRRGLIGREYTAPTLRERLPSTAGR